MTNTFSDKPDYTKQLDSDIRSIKKGLKVRQDTLGTMVFAVALDINDLDNNELMEIPICSGEPLNCEVYDVVRDEYHVEGVSYHEIGHIPVNYTLFMDGTSWEEDIPLPLSVINRHMTHSQKRLFKKWKTKYNSDNYEITFVQSLGTF